MLRLEDLKIGDYFSMFCEELDRYHDCVYVGQKIIPRLSGELGYKENQKLHSFLIDHVNYTHSYVAYGDEKVTKIDRTFRKDRFEPEHAVSIYDNYRYYTLKDGIYTRHHTKKIMMKYIARNYGVTACDFGSNHDIPDGAVVEWMHLEPLVKD